jgi:PAS domain-containing protein
MSWLNILESHFNQRKKAFLIFDDRHVLRYISDYAKEILEFDDNLMGFATLNELFPPSEKNPHFLVDKNYSFQPIHDILYTTPSGRSKELRINRDSELQTIGDLSGYIIWLEAKSRDITAVYRRVSSLDPYRNMGWLFDESNQGYILVNKEGIIEKSNDKIKEYISEPGEWRGRNIYTFSFLHQHGITSLIMKCLKNPNNKYSQNILLKTVGANHYLEIKWSILPLTDLEGSILGAIIVATKASN